jgi:hypothetical protein
MCGTKVGGGVHSKAVSPLVPYAIHAIHTTYFCSYNPALVSTGADVMNVNEGG